MKNFKYTVVLLVVVAIMGFTLVFPFFLQYKFENLQPSPNLIITIKCFSEGKTVEIGDSIKNTQFLSDFQNAVTFNSIDLHCNPISKRNDETYGITFWTPNEEYHFVISQYNSKNNYMQLMNNLKISVSVSEDLFYWLENLY